MSKPACRRALGLLVVLFFLSSVSVRAANISSNGSGLWSQAGTWNPAQVPTNADTVTISPGDTVTVDITTATASTSTVNGTLTFSTVGNSSLTLVGGNITVNAGGALVMGSQGAPIPAGTFAQLVLAAGGVPGQFGLIVNNGGSFTVRGAAKRPASTSTTDILGAGSAFNLADDPALSGWSVGDAITIGATQGSGPATTVKRTIIAIAGNTITVDSPFTTFHYASSTIRVCNLTRNVLVVSADPANPAYIQNLAQNSAGFNLVYGEFAFLGANAAQKDGILFSGAASRGSISSSTVHDGYRGIQINSASGITLSYNNVYANLDTGIYLNVASKNLLISNHSYGNSNLGIVLNVSSSNTLNSNNLYSNASEGLSGNQAAGNVLASNNIYSNAGSGVLFSNGSTGNIFFGDSFYSNSSNGISLQSFSGNNLFLSSYFFDNQSYGVLISTGSGNSLVGGGIGYDAGGIGRPNRLGTLSFDANVPGGESLVMKGVRANPAGGPSLAGFNHTGNYLLSYNQDQAKGVLALWGDYTLSASTWTFDYSLNLFASTATVPVLMFGSGHSAGVPSANDSNAVSQVISAQYDAAAGDWNVLGSVSGSLGTFTGSIANQPFPAGSPQFNLTFTQGASPQDGDRVTFALTAASNDMNAQKSLVFGPCAASLNRGRSKLSIDALGGLVLRGISGTNALMDRLSAASTYYSFVDSGAFTAAYSSMTNMDPDGIQLSGSAGVSIASSTFDSMGVAAATNAYITANGLGSSATFYALTFGLSRSTQNAPYAYNVLVRPPDNGLSWTLVNYAGPFSGRPFDFDPNNRVFWRFDPLPPPSIGAAPLPGQITVSWTAPSIPPALYLDHYEISYTSVSQSGPFNFLSAVSSGNPSYVHGGLANFTTYFYQVVTFDSTGDKSSPAQTFAVTPDTIPPAGVGNLSAALGSGAGQVLLSWNFPGDDGGTRVLSNGSQYAVQYTTNSGSVVWSTANAQVAFSTGGVAPGAAQSVVLGGLNQSATYYFSLWSADQALNWSPPSNVAQSQARQGGPAVVSFAPGNGSFGVLRSTTVTVTFNKTVRYGSFVSAFQLAMVRDNLANAANSVVAGNIAPAVSSNSFTFTPLAALNGNSQYVISVSTLALDLQNNPLQGAASAQFTTLMDRTVLNLFSDSVSGASVTVPAGALGTDGYFLASTVLVSPNLRAANQKLLQNTGDLRRAPVPGSVVDLKAYDGLGNNQGGSLAAPVTISLSYPDANNDGIVDGSDPPVRVETLCAHYVDDANALWVRLPSCQVNTAAKTVIALTPHFTTFALIGQSASDLSQAYPFPVPFRPSQGHTKITFTGLGQNTRIRIFTVTGKLVAELLSTAVNGQIDWDVTTTEGKPVASGVYLYLLQDGQNTATGKLAIVR